MECFSVKELPIPYLWRYLPAIVTLPSYTWAAWAMCHLPSRLLNWATVRTPILDCCLWMCESRFSSLDNRKMLDESVHPIDNLSLSLGRFLFSRFPVSHISDWIWVVPMTVYQNRKVSLGLLGSWLVRRQKLWAIVIQIQTSAQIGHLESQFCYVYGRDSNLILRILLNLKVLWVKFTVYIWYALPASCYNLLSVPSAKDLKC